MSRILTVSGSPSVVSRSAKLLDHVARELGGHGHEVEHLNVRDLPAEALLHAHVDHPAILATVEQLANVDAVVIATPVYKAAYTGLLKSWLDLLPQYALADKAILPLATGGSVAHALALDYGLRPVLSSMGARHIVQGFLVVDRFIETSPAGDVQIADEALDGLRSVVHGFLAALPSGHARSEVLLSA
jgi:FMN reductase